MAVALTRLSWWLWGGGRNDCEPAGSSGSPPSNPSPDFGLGFREADNVKFSSVKGAKMHSAVRRKWRSREEKRVDREHDVVLVPPDGVCLSGSESDDSDWSIGWMEAHAPEFLGEGSGGDGEGSFAVLVRCYGRGHCERAESSRKPPFLGATAAAIGIPDVYSSDKKEYVEQWLAEQLNS